MSKNKSIYKFSSSLGFIMAASGAAIGLANIWKFPYEVGANGGACFFIPYLFFTIIIGYPMLLTKAAFGRKMNAGMYQSYALSKGISKNIGVISVLVCICTLSFYNVVIGWILGYSLEVLKGNIFNQDNFGLYFKEFIKNTPLNIFYNMLTSISVFLIVKLGIKKGIEKFSKIFMPILVLILIVLIGYGFSLSNAFQGIKFYLFPDLSKFSIVSISSALSHSFFSLALGGGVMITYGAYSKNNSDLIKDSFIITISDFFIAFLAGLLIFPFIFHLKMKPNEGPALVFIVLPYVFKSLGIIKGTIIGFLFFLLLIFASITSAISMLEVPTKYLMEKYNFNRTKSAFIVTLIAYSLGLLSLLSNGSVDFLSNIWNNLSFMDILIMFIMKFLLPFSVLCFSIFIGNNWNTYKISEEINKDNNYSSFFLKYIYFSIRYLSPVLIFIVLITNFIF